MAEGLKQLLFPLTWQHQYVQPAGPDLADFVEAPSPVIFCCSPLTNDFSYFESQQADYPNWAILDIDGSYTNEKAFPKLPNEGDLLRALNNLKNKEI